MLLKVKIEKRAEGVTAIVLAGTIDTDTCQDLKEKISSCMASAPRVLMFDMAKVEYVSSLGIGTLIDAKKDIERISGTFMMINLQPQVAKVFEIVKALPDFNIFTSAEEADEYLFNIQKKMEEKEEEKKELEQEKARHKRDDDEN
jgi:anti-anti-sigma factor